MEFRLKYHFQNLCFYSIFNALALVTAWVRRLASSFMSRFETCVFTVLSEIKSFLAISWLDSPFEVNTKTSYSLPLMPKSAIFLSSISFGGASYLIFGFEINLLTKYPKPKNRIAKSVTTPSFAKSLKKSEYLLNCNKSKSAKASKPNCITICFNIFLRWTGGLLFQIRIQFVCTVKISLWVGRIAFVPIRVA